MPSGRRFELRRRLGSGSFGNVFLADMISTGGFRKQVALKMLRPGLGASSDAGRRLRDEARVLGRLQHRHIVKVDDLVSLDERWAMVMEFVPGLDLEELVARFPELARGLPPRVVAELAVAVGSALDAAYNHRFDGGAPLRLVHRDIKPSNIRLAPDGQLKVLDFGIARAEFEEREASTEQVRYGSIPYMSPERLLGEAELPAGDVYALGSVLLELLTGERFGRAPLRQEEHDARREELVGRVAAGSEDAGLKGLAGLLDDCLRFDPEQRPSAAEVAEVAAALAPELAGPDLSTWARQTYAGAVLEVGKPLEGEPTVLQEHTSGGSLLVGAPSDTDVQAARGRAPTIIPDLDPDLELAAADEGERTTSPLIFVIPALIAAGVVLVVGMGVVGPGDEPRGAAEDAAAEAAAGEAAAPEALELSRVEATQDPVDGDAGDAEAGDAEAGRETAGEAENGALPSPDGEAAEGEALEGEAPGAGGASTTAATGSGRRAGSSGGSGSTRTTERAGSEGRASSDRPSSGSSTGAGGAASAPAEGETTPETASTGGSGETLRAVKVAVPEASSVRASCGEVSASGATSALLRNVPAGSCSVEAVVEGRTLRGSLTATRPAGFTCDVQGDALTCR